MRIVIDARLNAYRTGGIPQYTRQLVAAMAEIAREDRFITLQHRDHQRPLTTAPNVARLAALTPPHNRFEEWTLPLELLRARPDVLHSPDFIAPRRRPCPAVATIHDLAFLRFPDILDDAARAFYGRIKESAARTEALIAVSESTRQDIAQYLDIPPERVEVVYEAAAPLYSPLDLRADEVRVLNGTPVGIGTFMLFVSTLEPRKNLPTLLKALRICIDRRPGRAYRLVVVGARGWRDDAIFTTLRDLKLEEHVIFAGRAGDYDLRWLYSACRIYVNPSIYEGFGLPLLEAMACGAACLASAASCLPEIGGDAAVYVSPLEPEAWAAAIEELWDDEERRSELGRLGRQRALTFSWARAARETLAIYRRVAQPESAPLAAPPPPAGQPAAEAAPPSDAPDAQPGLAPRPADAPPACLRCGAPMRPARLQQPVGLEVDRSGEAGEAVHLTAWLCAGCGAVELSQARADAEPQDAAGSPTSTSDASPNGHAEPELPAEPAASAPAPRRAQRRKR